MKSLCVLFLVLVLLNSSSGDGYVRRKRFFNTLWPSEEVASDVNDGLIYSQLPPDYLFLLPGVNDHKPIQRRAGVQQQQAPLQPLPPRFVHPTRMALLMQPHQQQQQKVNQLPANGKLPAGQVTQLQQVGPRIVMKPVMQAPNGNPSILLKTKEQALPDIHKNNRFVQPKPVQRATQRPLIQPFNTQQQLPIKKSFDTAPDLQSEASVLSVRTASINDFYYTREFRDLLEEFKLKVELDKLPAISDVMAILGTTNADDTLKSIRDVAQSKEGMELIKGYLDHNEDDQFYNYDEDVGAGEILVDGSEDGGFDQSYQNVQQNQPQKVSFGNFNQNFATPLQTFEQSSNQATPVFSINPRAPLPAASPPRASTTGTLTGTGNSWWRPASWFSSSTSPKVESVKTDGEIFQKIIRVPTSGSVWDNINYVGNFLRPASKESAPITPNSQVSRSFILSPLTSQPATAVGSSRYPPTVQMTEAQFQDMVKALKLVPMNMQVEQKAPKQHVSVADTKTVRQFKPTTPPPQESEEVESAVPDTKGSDMWADNSKPLDATVQSLTPQSRFQAPINVQPVSAGIPLPSTFSQLDNRRNFISVSEPQRAAPYDFIASGRVHKANPDEVSKRSRSLVEAIEGKR